MNIKQGGAVKGAVLARRIRELLVAHIHLFAFAFFKGGVTPRRYFGKKKKFLCNFHKELLRAARQLTDLHGHLFIFLSRRNGGVPPARRSSEKFDRSAGIWLGEIRPICAGNETAWQGHNGNYIRRAYSATV